MTKKPGKFKKLKLELQRSQKEAESHKRGRKQKSVIQGSPNQLAGRQDTNKSITSMLTRMSTHYGELLGKEWPDWYELIKDSIFQVLSTGRIKIRTNSLFVLDTTMTTEDFRKDILPIANRLNLHFGKQTMTVGRLREEKAHVAGQTWTYVIVVCFPFGEYQLPAQLSDAQIQYFSGIRDFSRLKSFQDDQDLEAMKGTLLLPINEE